MNVPTTILYFLFLFLVAGVAPNRADAMTDEERAAQGFALLKKNCSRCHAIELTGASPHPQAPPFRDVVKRYPVEDLEESLAEGIMSGHPDMPEFTFEADQIDAIVAYLNSLKASENAK
ncbi:MAG: cytochrome c [Hyphomicrobium sp.]|uniref:c-type cytochrome n=1 Tax=Hyphomicrobium sp. TaxID=82 RepID=UPI0039E5DBFF